MSKASDPYLVPVTADVAAVARLLLTGHCPSCGGAVSLENGGSSVFVDHTTKQCPQLIRAATTAAHKPPRKPR